MIKCPAERKPFRRAWLSDNRPEKHPLNGYIAIKDGEQVPLSIARWRILYLFVAFEFVLKKEAEM